MDAGEVWEIDWDDDGYASAAADVSADVEDYDLELGAEMLAAYDQIIGRTARGFVRLYGGQYDPGSPDPVVTADKLREPHLARLTAYGAFVWEGMARPTAPSLSVRQTGYEWQLQGRHADKLQEEVAFTASDSTLAEVAADIEELTGVPFTSKSSMPVGVAGGEGPQKAISLINEFCVYGIGWGLEGRFGDWAHYGLDDAAAEPIVHVMTADMGLTADKTVVRLRPELRRELAEVKTREYAEPIPDDTSGDDATKETTVGYKTFALKPGEYLEFTFVKPATDKRRIIRWLRPEFTYDNVPNPRARMYPYPSIGLSKAPTATSYTVLLVNGTQGVTRCAVRFKAVTQRLDTSEALPVRAKPRRPQPVAQIVTGLGRRYNYPAWGASGFDGVESKLQPFLDAMSEPVAFMSADMRWNQADGWALATVIEPGAALMLIVSGAPASYVGRIFIMNLKYTGGMRKESRCRVQGIGVDGWRQPAGLTRFEHTGSSLHSADLAFGVVADSFPVTIHYRYRKTGDTAWTTDSVSATTERTTIHLTGLDSGTGYEAEAALDSTFPAASKRTVAFDTNTDYLPRDWDLTNPDTTLNPSVTGACFVTGVGYVILWHKHAAGNNDRHWLQTYRGDGTLVRTLEITAALPAGTLEEVSGMAAVGAAVIVSFGGKLTRIDPVTGVNLDTPDTWSDDGPTTFVGTSDGWAAASLDGAYVLFATSRYETADPSTKTAIVISPAGNASGYGAAMSVSAETGHNELGKLDHPTSRTLRFFTDDAPAGQDWTTVGADTPATLTLPAGDYRALMVTGTRWLAVTDIEVVAIDRDGTRRTGDPPTPKLGTAEYTSRQSYATIPGWTTASTSPHAATIAGSWTAGSPDYGSFRFRFTATEQQATVDVAHSGAGTWDSARQRVTGLSDGDTFKLTCTISAGVNGKAVFVLDLDVDITTVQPPALPPGDTTPQITALSVSRTPGADPVLEPAFAPGVHSYYAELSDRSAPTVTATFTVSPAASAWRAEFTVVPATHPTDPIELTPVVPSAVGAVRTASLSVTDKDVKQVRIRVWPVSHPDDGYIVFLQFV